MGRASALEVPRRNFKANGDLLTRAVARNGGNLK
jgi:hypothetical protein